MHSLNITLSAKAIGLVLCGALLAGCNPAQSDPSDEIVGRWESSRWNYGKRPLFVEFTGDGTLTYSYIGGPFEGKWLMLDSGELQVTRGHINPARCSIAISGKEMTFSNPDCMGWEEVGSTLVLEKQ